MSTIEQNRGGSTSEGTLVSLSAFAYIYSELVQYHQGRAASISELERRLESAGYGVGLKVLEMVAYRAKEVCVVVELREFLFGWLIGSVCKLPFNVVHK